MTDADRGHQHESNTLHVPSVASSPTAAIFVVSLLAALGAAGAVYGLGDLVGLGVAVAIGVVGAGVAAFAAGKPPAAPETKANALLEAASAEDAPAEPPSRFRGEPWASLYRRAAGYVEAQRSATLAVQEVERLRSELEQKTSAPASFEPRPSHAEHELVGGGVDGVVDGEGAGVSDSAETAVTAARAREAVEELVAPIGQGLASIESELAPLLQSLQAQGSNAEGTPNGHPAKMVDALVRTAADGIEDLAAGLMRANELAIVAERVTNRATLLALNAALEATRSGSEAFASIAEETRRLAEYAREATDTISRLSSEIELKVGETIGSIQSSSEDAKAAVDSIRTGGASSRAVAPETLQALESLLARVRALRERAEAAVAPPPPPPAPDDTSSYAPPVADDSPALPALQESEPTASFVTLGSAPHEDTAEVADSGSAPAWNVVRPATDSPSDSDNSHESFGSRSIEDTGAAAETEIAAPRPEAEAEEPEAAAPEVAPTKSPAEPPAEPKIPDWLEGIGPRDHR